MTTDKETYRRQFLDEARDILEKANEDILKAETNPEDKELMNSLFRGIHTIKGSAGAFDFDEISKFTHYLEGLLSALRDGKVALSSEITDAILEGLDYLNGMVDSSSRGEEAVVDEALAEKFLSLYDKKSEEKNNAVKSETDDDETTSNMAGLPPDLAESFEEFTSCGLNIFCVEVNYTSELFENGYDPLIFLRNLKESSKHYHPVVNQASPVAPLDDFEPFNLYLQPTVYIATEIEMTDIEDLAFEPSLITVRQLKASLPEKAEETVIEFDKENLEEFLRGCGEMIESLEKAIISYESSKSSDALNNVFRIVHTIKGDADLVGLVKLTEFAHSLETLLDRMRSGVIDCTVDVIDTLLKATDSLKWMLIDIKNGKQISSYPEIYGRIQEYFGEGKVSDIKETPSVPDEMMNIFVEQALQHRDILSDNIKTLPADSSRKKIIRRSLDGLCKASSFVKLEGLNTHIQNALSVLDGADDSKLSDAVDNVIVFIDGFSKDTERLGEILVREGKVSEDDVKEAVSKQKHIGEILVEEKKVSEESVKDALKKQKIMEIARQVKPDMAADTEIRTMRVDENKVEKLSNVIGELLVTRNTFEHLLAQFDNVNGGEGKIIKSLNDNLHLLSRVTNDIHYGIMSLRMIPIKGVFQKFNRVVRDISRKQNKIIDFVTEGEETEIDKKVADTLSDPLIHLVRNSCDHGIEIPDERKRAGKPQRGIVSLKASQEGSNLIIKISDDGKGLNRQTLFEKAKTMGMDVKSPDDEGLLDVIFIPGFSTKEVVTDVSGRGVGMDVVKTTLNSLGGNVTIESDEGKGSETTLCIPMTMGISETLLVESGKKTYAIPIDYVVETIKIKPEKLRMHRGKAFFHYRDEVLPTAWLDQLLDGTGMGRETRLNGEEISVAVLRTGAGKSGVVVDRFIRNMEIAIKPMPESLLETGVVNGVSILGDGRVVLVLNPEMFV